MILKNITSYDTGNYYCRSIDYPNNSPRGQIFQLDLSIGTCIMDYN